MQPQAGKLQFNQSYNVGVSVQQGQARLSFSEITLPPPPVGLKLPVADYHKHNPAIRLDKLVTDAPSGVARMQASDKIAATGEVSLVITSPPPIKSPESPLTPLWLKFQPMPALFKALGESGQELEGQVKTAQAPPGKQAEAMPGAVLPAASNQPPAMPKAQRKPQHRPQARPARQAAPKPEQQRHRPVCCQHKSKTPPAAKPPPAKQHH